MSSPVKRRTALAGKNVNVKQTSIKGGIYKSNHSSCNSSPIKKSQVGLTYALKHSPIRNVSVVESPKKTPQKAASPFIFHEETPSEKAAVLMEHVSLKQRFHINNDENTSEHIKENIPEIKSPSKLKESRRNERAPLQDLSIEEYAGFIEDPKMNETTPLTLHYKNKTILPNFVTPPRDNKLRQYFTYNETKKERTTSRSTDDIPKDKIVKKLNFKISSN